MTGPGQPYSMCPVVRDCRPVRLETGVVEVSRPRRGGSQSMDVLQMPPRRIDLVPATPPEVSR